MLPLKMRFLLQLSLLAYAIALGACSNSSAECGDLALVCDNTLIILQSPANAWAAGMYSLHLSLDGRAAECTLSLADSVASGTASTGSRIVEGTCSENDITLELVQLCPQSVVVCDAGVCGARVGFNCFPGQFEMHAVVSAHGFGADAKSGVVSEVALDLSVDGTELMQESVSPKATTAEPNGPGCGTCTTAAVTISVAGG